MGCGASVSRGAHRYQANPQVSALDGLADDNKRKKLLEELDGEPAADSPEGGRIRPREAAQQSDRYKAGRVVDGVEIVEGDPTHAALANDGDLLRKYAAEESQGKRRKAPNTRVFAPTNGSLSGEPVLFQHKKPEQRCSDEYDPLQGNTVGGLKLSHNLVQGQGSAVRRHVT